MEMCHRGENELQHTGNNDEIQFVALLLLPSSAATNLISALAVLDAMLLSRTLCLNRNGKVFLKDFWKVAPMKPYTMGLTDELA
ncbi:hypothetical protein EYF80_022308 [Liparis tanakae]|uniref:Uncharacterized protein n=1 Tax=Liparis tanakae TaxID=230148 RepID=A0A4Z2HRR6_9TELE|nr:hypothetical protein EYF80_022308 [Liparis tanakae]